MTTAPYMKPIIIDINEIDYSLPVSFYVKKYNLSENALRNRFKRLGVYDNFKFVGKNNSSVKRHDNILVYGKSPKLCKFCNKPIDYDKSENDFCSQRCAAYHRNKFSPNEYTEKHKERLSQVAKSYNSVKFLDRYWSSLPGGRHSPRPTSRTSGKYVERTLSCPTCGQSFATRKNRKFCSQKCSRKSDKLGGFRRNSGRGKMGWYKGYHCQSSWELAWVIYSLEHGTKFERNGTGFPYIFEGENHKFFPDFYLPEEETFVEIKGWPSELTQAKIEQFPNEIKVLYKKEMLPILDYVIGKYGNDFIRLYEKNSIRKDKTLTNP